MKKLKPGIRVAESKAKVDRLIRTRAFRYVTSFTFAFFLALVLTQSSFFNIDFLESYTYDLRLRLRPAPTASPLIHIINIDRKTLQEMKTHPTLMDHARLLSQLKAVSPKVVIYTFSPLRISGAVSDSTQFVANALSLPLFMVASPDMPVTDRWELHRLSPPFDNLLYVPAAKTTDKRSFAKDNYTRRQLLTSQDKSLLDLRVARFLRPTLPPPNELRGAFEHLMTWQIYTDYLPLHSYDTLSFSEALYSPKLLERLRGHVVIVGLDTEEDSTDYVQTPFSKGTIDMPLSEVHANMIDAVLRDHAPVRSPLWLNFLITFVMGLITLNVALKIRPARGLTLLSAIVAVFLLLCYGAFAMWTYWLPMAAPMVAMFISYYFFIPYRLIIENRRSWEYYQKNKLLMQVEELKNNFVSMMSHDLKTPLARIQGMTDVIAQDENALSPQQADALSFIRKSSEELSNFISSILDLGRIESQEIKLQLASRDINALLEDVVRRYDFLAREKNITVVRELEPLFSLRMDVELIHQVFANLIENAIKYSKPGGRVLITSEEENGKVIVQVADQGMGIPTDEIPHLFVKFYRSKDARTSTIKGTGLGLYLAKYFVELHNGSISVDSTVGVGTTFTVELPMDTSSR